MGGDRALLGYTVDEWMRAGSYAFICGWLVAVVTHVYSWDAPIWALRVGKVDGGHLLDWLLLLGVALIAASYPFEVNGFRGLLLSGFVLSYHELVWNIGAVVSDYRYWLAHQWSQWGFRIFPVVFAVCFISVWRSGFYKFMDRRLLLIGLLEYPIVVAFWVALGFEVSAYGGLTIWGENPFVNIAEITQWYAVGVPFLLAYLLGVRGRVFPLKSGGRE